MFIDLETKRLKTKLLIDSAASLPLLYKRMYDRLPDNAGRLRQLRV